MTNLEKHLLMSIRPEHAANILNGKKTLEIRKVIPKWAIEELRKGNQVKCLMYVTKRYSGVYIQKKGEPNYFGEISEKFYTVRIPQTSTEMLGGSIPFMVTFDDVIDLTYALGWGGGLHPEFDEEDIAKKACLTVWKLLDYTQAEKGLALHISSVRIFDKPMQLSDCFFTRGKYLSDYEKLALDNKGNVNEEMSVMKYQPITRAPQNCMTVYAEV